MDDIKNVVRIEKTRVIKDYSVGIYARVSTNSKEQLDSLANQISGLTRLASAHRTWFVADIFIDVGTAKTGSTREEFNRMIREKSLRTRYCRNFGGSTKDQGCREKDHL